MKPLTSCERVNRMMEHRDHDRIPRHESFWQETITRWHGEGLEGGAAAVLELLESDFRSLCWCWPEVFPGTEKILSEDAATKVVLDGQGKRVRHWKHKSGTPEHLGFECDSREVFWPQHKRLADWAHANGMKVIYHTDGNVNGVIDLYIEAGFDCLQPLETKAGMDVRTLSPRCGDRLALFGNIDVMIMITNDRNLIEQEIASKFSAAMATKGYAYHSDHSVPPQVSWSTCQFIIDCVKKYGNYQT